MTDVNWVEMLGYLATVLTGVSLSLSSIVRLRIFNMMGCICFASYGLFIGSYPVTLLNSYLTIVNIVYLCKMTSGSSHFRMLTASVKDQYVHEFLEMNRQDIQLYFPNFKLFDDKDYTTVMVHQDMALAGIVICHRIDDSTVEIDLDFVMPSYRDLKPGQFVFKDQSGFFKRMGVKRLVSTAGSEVHAKYLSKIGFSRKDGFLELKLGA